MRRVGDAGSRDMLVTLLRPGPAVRKLGGSAETPYLDAGNEWAQRLGMRVGEQDRAGGITASAEFKLIIPYRDDVEPTWRVRDTDTGDEFALTGVEPMGRRESLALYVKGVA